MSHLNGIVEDEQECVMLMAKNLDKESEEKTHSHLRDISLKASGLAYLAGDASLFVSGRMAGRNKEANAGALYALGGVLCALFGNPSADKQLKLLIRRLGDYLKKQGVEIPKSPTTVDMVKPGGLLEHITTFLYKYPTQILNLMFAYGGTQLFQSGRKKNKPWDAVAGVCVTAGGLAGLLITEGKSDSDHPPHGAIAQAMDWIREKPLRLTGALYMANNVALTLSAYGERKDYFGARKDTKNKSYLFKFLTVACYLFANSMLTLSSKDNVGAGAREKSTDNAVSALADVSAKVIAAQHPELQEALVQNIAGYLSSQPEIKKTAPEIASLLHKKLVLVSQKQSPALAENWQSRMQIAPEQGLNPSL